VTAFETERVATHAPCDRSSPMGYAPAALTRPYMVVDLNIEISLYRITDGSQVTICGKMLISTIVRSATPTMGAADQ
jgi:hypothetical protein